MIYEINRVRLELPYYDDADITSCSCALELAHA